MKPYCNYIQTPFLEALRPLDGQIKLRLMLKKIPPAKSHPANTTTRHSIVPRESL